MGLPRCKGRLALDIQEYLNKHEMDIKSFVDRKPGTVIISYQNIHFNENFKFAGHAEHSI